MYILAGATKVPKSLPLDTIIRLKMYQKCFRGRGSTLHPAREAHNILQDPLAGFGDASLQGGERREGEERVTGGEEGKDKEGRRGGGWRSAPRVGVDAPGSTNLTEPWHLRGLSGMSSRDGEYESRQED